MRVFISGQKYFAEQIFDLCRKKGFEIVGVCCPLDDKYIGAAARLHDVPIIPAGSLSARTMPPNVDLGVTAHSFDYIGKKTRYKARLGWIGYHPSLLPRHRGRSSIEWTIRMRDVVTGGTVFWLNSGIDRGDIAAQDWRWIPPKYYAMDPGKAASRMWREELLPLGVHLMDRVLDDVQAGRIIREPQRKDVSTWEPSTDVNDIYRPDALMLEFKG